MIKIPVITIDGPSGAGKGSLALKLATKMNFNLLDSGAIYRLAALSVEREQISMAHPGDVVAAISGMKIKFEPGDDVCLPFLKGEDVSAIIRQDNIAQLASKLAAMPQVRSALLQLQKDFLKPPGLVADGRDMGTVVFPDANCKIFLLASAEERAKRRYKQLNNMGFDCNIDQLLSDIQERDGRDMARAESPLRPAKDAIVVDSTNMTFDTVFDLVYSHILDMQNQ